MESFRHWSIGIIGCGVVGSAIARSYLEYARVRTYDIVPERKTFPLLETLDSDIVFLCLPEAEVPKTIQKIANFLPNYQRTLVIKSTVPVGTTEELKAKHNLPNLIHSPEFLTERCAFQDACIPSRNIIGIPNGKDCFGRHELETLYRYRFPSVPVHIMSSKESETVKLFQNALFAAKVSLLTEFRDLTDHMGMRWELILNAILADGRIAHSHTKVPGPDGKRGFGGKCLPKDLDQLINAYNDNDLLSPILSAVSRRNFSDRL